MACVVTQTLGFGTDAAGVRAFSGANAPLGSLAEAYVDAPMARALEVGAMVSALGAGLGGVLVASRMLFALSRDASASGGWPASPRRPVRPRRRSP